MTYIGVKKRLVNIPSSTLGVIPTILRKKKNVRKVSDLDNSAGSTFVYWVDGLGVGSGFTMVIRIDPDSD